MKKIFLLMMTVMGFSCIQAQMKEGTVIYERKLDMYRRITDEQMRAMFPQFNTTKQMLIFSDSTSVYQAVPEDEAPDPFAGGGGNRVIVRMGGGDNSILYKNFASDKSIQSSELGAKTYIVEDSIRKQKWKLTDETKKILGHNCRKAITQQTIVVGGGGIRMVMNGGGAHTDTTSKTEAPKPTQADVIAWYADDIPTPVGPENNGGLPGLILQLDINNAETVYTATEIKKEVNKKDLKEPTKGKKVTRAEFVNLQKEAMGNQMQGAKMTRFSSF